MSRVVRKLKRIGLVEDDSVKEKGLLRSLYENRDLINVRRNDNTVKEKILLMNVTTEPILLNQRQIERAIKDEDGNYYITDEEGNKQQITPRYGYVGYAYFVSKGDIRQVLLPDNITFETIPGVYEADVVEGRDWITSLKFVDEDVRDYMGFEDDFSLIVESEDDLEPGIWILPNVVYVGERESKSQRKYLLFVAVKGADRSDESSVFITSFDTAFGKFLKPGGGFIIARVTDSGILQRPLHVFPPPE